MDSGSTPGGAALPEVLIASTEFAAAQGDDGVCAIDGPVHASPFEASSDRYFAASLDNAGGCAQALGAKLWVAHARAIAEDVHRAFDRLVGGSGMEAESVDNRSQFAFIQFLASRIHPHFAFAGCAEDRLRGPVQSFFGVVPIQDLSGLGEQFRSRVPDPGRAVA